MSFLAAKRSQDAGPGNDERPVGRSHDGAKTDGLQKVDAAAAVAAVPSAPTKSSFFLGLRILPEPQRVAMYAIYGFCRSVDDIADGDEPRDIRIAALEHWRSDIAALYAGERIDSLVPLARAIGDFDLRQADFEAVIDGMAMDGAEDIVAPDRPAFDRYIDRVASAPGRLSVRVFGLPEASGMALAHHLGRALQITNILRDLDEDAALGRLYLPRDALTAAGIAAPAGEDDRGAGGGALSEERQTIARVLADSRLAAVCERLAAEAHDHFARADAIMDTSPRKSVRAPRLMSAAYRSLLDALIVRGWVAPRRRVSKKKRVMLLALLRHGFF